MLRDLRHPSAALSLLCALALAACDDCGSGISASDPGPDGAADAGSVDAVSVDHARADLGQADRGVVADAGALDGAGSDTSSSDALLPDRGAPDLLTDLVLPDSAAPDGQGVDAAGRPVFVAHILELDLDFAAGAYTVADVDGDGHNDILGTGDAPRVWWSRHDDVETKHVIAQSATLGYEVHAADVDGDGDPDLLGSGDGVTWFENPRPGGDPASGAWTQHTVLGYPSGESEPAHDLRVGDIDGDGRLDGVTRGQNTSAYNLYLQRSDGSGWDRVAVAASRSGEGTALGDVDGDGDLDLSDGWAWFECPDDARAQAWTQHDVGDATHHLTRVQIVDMDGDGRRDIISSPSEYGGGQLVWFKAPADPIAESWVPYVMYDGDDPNFHTLQVGDLDLDGDNDVLTGQTGYNDRRTMMLYYNDDGVGTAWSVEEHRLTDGLWQGTLADVASDGDLDILFSNYQAGSQGEYWENVGGDAPGLSLDRWTFFILDDARADGQTFGLDVRDLDQDGDPDLVTGQYVYLNPGSITGAWARRDLPTKDALLTLDVDGDAFADVLAIEPAGCHWLEAGDAAATTWSDTVVSPQGADDHGFSTQGYTRAQLVPGGALEAVYSTHEQGVVLLEVPADPSQAPWPLTVVHPSYAEGLAPGDVDQDGDLDLCGGDDLGNVYWAENPAVGGGAGWTIHVVGALDSAEDRIAVADLDGDGDLDMVVTEEQGSGRLQLFEQPDGDPSSTSWPTRTLAATGYGFLSMHVADFDADGRPDIIAAESTDALEHAIWRNLGSWQFEKHPLPNPQARQSHIGCWPVDLDNDGDLDVVSVSWTFPAELYVWRNDSF